MTYPLRQTAVVLFGLLALSDGARAAERMNAADQAMASGMTTMQQRMAAAPMTGDTDHDFVVMMMPHHAGAVDMAKIELREGKSPELRRLARSIVADQQSEIAQMQAWLASHPNG